MNSKKEKGLRKLATASQNPNNPLDKKETYKQMKKAYKIFKKQGV